MLQYIDKYTRPTLNRMIGRNILLLHGEHAESFCLIIVVLLAPGLNVGVMTEKYN